MELKAVAKRLKPPQSRYCRFRFAVSGYKYGARHHLLWWSWDGTRADIRRMLYAISVDARYHEDIEYVLWATNARSPHSQSLPHEDATALIDEINTGN